MRSRSNSTEIPDKSKQCHQRQRDHHKEDTVFTGIVNTKQGKKENDYTAQSSTILRSPRSENKQRSYSKKGEDLSRDDLLFLLSVLEGELQVNYFLVLYSVNSPLIHSLSSVYHLLKMDGASFVCVFFIFRHCVLLKYCTSTNAKL